MSEYYTPVSIVLVDDHEMFRVGVHAEMDQRRDRVRVVG